MLWQRSKISRIVEVVGLSQQLVLLKAIMPFLDKLVQLRLRSNNSLIVLETLTTMGAMAGYQAMLSSTWGMQGGSTQRILIIISQQAIIDHNAGWTHKIFWLELREGLWILLIKTKMSSKTQLALPDRSQ